LTIKGVSIGPLDNVNQVCQMTQIFDLQSDGIDMDALSGDFARDALSEFNHASLGDTMIGAPRNTTLAQHAGGIDDGAARL
jgi:hypothetical protein